MSHNPPSRLQTARPAALHCLGFRPIAWSGSLIGTIDLHVPWWRAKLYGCGVFRNNGHWSVALPVRALVGTERRIREDASGKALYEPVLAFDDPVSTKAFSDAAVQALMAYRPDLFAGENR